MAEKKVTKKKVVKKKKSTEVKTPLHKKVVEKFPALHEDKLKAYLADSPDKTVVEILEEVAREENNILKIILLRTLFTTNLSKGAQDNLVILYEARLLVGLLMAAASLYLLAQLSPILVVVIAMLVIAQLFKVTEDTYTNRIFSSLLDFKFVKQAKDKRRKEQEAKEKTEVKEEEEEEETAE